MSWAEQLNCNGQSVNNANQAPIKEIFHSAYSVSQNFTKKDLTNSNYCNTLIVSEEMKLMANVLDRDKQIAIIGALAEGSSIRQLNA